MKQVALFGLIANIIVCCSPFSLPSFSFNSTDTSYSLTIRIPGVISVSKVPSFSEMFQFPSFYSKTEVTAEPPVAPDPRKAKSAPPPSTTETPSVGFDIGAVISRYTSFKNTLPKTVLEDADALVPELIENRGYPCETHKVTTADDYILTLHRIPHGRHGPSENRPAVFLQHGILGSSADWVLASPENGLAYILADAGYDVWMGNARGNRYSRDHQILDPDNAYFWDFSWHEIAIYDIPAMIDHTLDRTSQEKLHYIGFSQGTTVFYVMCSEMPQYNNKIKVMISLAPIAYMSHMTSPLFQIMARTPGLQTFLKLFGINEFLPYSRFSAQVGKRLCNEKSSTQILCTNTVFALCGFNQRQMNATLLPTIMGHTPAGASTKQLLHYAQEIRSGRFSQWDYGSSTNDLLYNSDEPPRYQLSKVTTPVYLFYSRNDWLSGETDVVRLYTELGNAREKFLVADSKFNHLDYLFGKEAPELVYDSILKLMYLY